MSDNGRKIFPLETALQVLSNKTGSAVNELLSFAIQGPVCDNVRPMVAPIVRGWLYSLQPEFLKTGTIPEQGVGIWLGNLKQKLGDNISIPPLPAEEIKDVVTFIEKMNEVRQNLQDTIEELDETKESLKDATPFKAKAEKLEEEKKSLTEKISSLNEEIGKLKAENATFAGKVAINEKEIEQSVKDLVSRAVKDALASLPAGGGAVVAAGGAGEAALVEEAAPIDSFGFGASGSDGDGFGF